MKNNNITRYGRAILQSFGCDVELVQEYRFHQSRKWRFDVAIPSHMIAVEIEGGVWTNGRHTRGSGFINDMEKYNTATAMGWSIFRCVPDDVYSTKIWSLVAQLIEHKK